MRQLSGLLHGRYTWRYQGHNPCQIFDANRVGPFSCLYERNHGIVHQRRQRRPVTASQVVLTTTYSLYETTKGSTNRSPLSLPTNTRKRTLHGRKTQTVVVIFGSPTILLGSELSLEFTIALSGVIWHLNANLLYNIRAYSRISQKLSSGVLQDRADLTCSMLQLTPTWLRRRS